MKYTKNLEIAVICATMIAFSGAGYAQRPTRLQVLVTGDAAKADKIVHKLNSLKAGPAKAIESGGVYKVVTRVYPSLAEANLAKPFIVGNGFNGAFAVAEPAAKTKLKAASPLGDSVPSVASLGSFNEEKFDFSISKPKTHAQKKSAAEISALQTLDNNVASEQQLRYKAFSYAKQEEAISALEALDVFIKRFPDSPYTPQVKLSRAYWFVKTGDIPQAISAFKAIARGLPTDPVAGEATLRLGYLNIQQKAYDKALPLFHSVGSGKITAEPEIRAEAILRLAALYHRGKDLESADACYRVLQSITLDQNLHAFAEVHRAGLALEMAWNDKSTFAKARERCDSLLADYPQAPKSIRATAALMALETLAYEDKYDEMMKREPAALEEMSGTAESSLGYYWIAKAHMKTGDVKGGAEILQTMIDLPVSTQERFKEVDMLPQARRLASEAYEKLGDKARAQAVLRK